MKILAYGDIMEGGTSVFTTILKIKGDELIVSFKGVIRVDDPYKYLSYFIKDIETKIDIKEIKNTIIDFTELKYTNSNGFYVLMDIIENIYKNTKGAITVKRLKEDDWQQETLPILLNCDDKKVSSRIELEDQYNL
jgi:hypothetical protein